MEKFGCAISSHFEAFRWRPISPPTLAIIIIIIIIRPKVHEIITQKLAFSSITELLTFSVDCVVLVTVSFSGAWTAGRRVNDTDFVWKVVTSKTASDQPIQYHVWRPTQPSGAGRCLALYKTSNFQWEVSYCTYKYLAVCEIDIA